MGRRIMIRVNRVRNKRVRRVAMRLRMSKSKINKKLLIQHRKTTKPSQRNNQKNKMNMNT